MIIRSKKISSRHWKIKEKARALRAQGMSYKEILSTIPVSKSTISLWCRDVPLTLLQKKRLWQKRDLQMSGIRAIQTMFWNRRCEAFSEGVARCVSVDAKSRYIAGLMLYWAEGSKGPKPATIANSDPRVIRFMVQWFTEFFEVPPEHLTISLHLHSGQNENKMKLYWSRLTGIPLRNFRKSFIKPEGSGYRKNILYNGTVKLTVFRPGSSYILFKILGGINGFLSQTIGEPIQPEKWMPKPPHAK